MPNYGDVALNLQPDWNRKLLTNKKHALWIVGHENGKADAALKKEPDKRHQFSWIDVRYHDELAMHLSSGFSYVNRDEWNINESLWQWNAEGKVFNQGQLLLARPAAQWFAQQAEVRKELGSRRDEDMEAAMNIADKAGLRIETDDQPARAARR